jgi:hypothetical protein
MKELIFGVNDVKYEDGTGVAEVAIYNEYGTRNIPPRPAFRMGLESAINTNKKMIDAQMKNITNRILTGRSSEIERSLTVLLTQIGRSAKAATQDLIRSGAVKPSNAPSTIAKKGFDHPLYETGLLLENVNYEVIDE